MSCNQSSSLPHGLLVIFIAVSSLSIVASGGNGLQRSSAATTADSDGGARINPDGYTSARVCGSCHVDIYNSWKNSLHAYSLIDPIFDTAYMQAIKDGGEEARRMCLHCHAPMTMMNGDYDLSLGVTREGVSCDFCHTVKSVHLDGREKPFTTDVSPVKRGVIKKAESPAHEVAFSELHGKAEFCGGCHNHSNSHGATIMGTYEEWRKGPYATEGIQCQDCHMTLSSGKVVSEIYGKETDKIHLHSLIHDSNQLRDALKVEMTDARRGRDGLAVEVVVENVGSGHMVPTGIPTREVVLDVTVEAGSYSAHQQRRFRKVVADKNGNVLKADYEIFLYGAQILNDNRIAPRERRVERFQFPFAASVPVKVKARLGYMYSPSIVGVKQMNIELGKAEKALP